MSELSDLITRHCRSGITETAVPGLTLSRSSELTCRTAFVYHPLLCVVAQGRKRIFLGNEELFYDPNCYLVASLDVPASGQVVEAPCLGLTLALDRAKLAELLLEVRSVGRDTMPKALAVHALDDDLLEPLLRLLRLLDRREDIAVMAPLIERELYYRLLLGPRGALLRQLARSDSQLAPIRFALTQMRERFDQPMRVEELARLVGMSPTSFHRHFRAVTAMSPVQLLKQIRLHEARRQLLSRETEVARAALNVGYESASQFSREYRRLFGVPPSRDRMSGVDPEVARAGSV